MGPIRLLKFVVKKLDRKMRQAEPGIYHPINATIGELADKLCVLTLQVRSSKCVAIETVREMERTFSQLVSKGFDFDSSHYEMLFQVISDIEYMKAAEGNSTDLISLDQNLARVRQGLRQSLVEAISAIHRDPRTLGPPV